MITSLPPPLSPVASRNALYAQNQQLHAIAQACLGQLDYIRALLEFRDRENNALRIKLSVLTTEDSMVTGQGMLADEQSLQETARKEVRAYMRSIFEEAGPMFAQIQQDLVANDEDQEKPLEEKEVGEMSEAATERVQPAGPVKALEVWTKNTRWKRATTRASQLKVTTSPRAKLKRAKVPDTPCNVHVALPSASQRRLRSATADSTASTSAHASRAVSSADAGPSSTL